MEEGQRAETGVGSEVRGQPIRQEGVSKLKVSNFDVNSKVFFPFFFWWFVLGVIKVHCCAPVPLR